MRYEITILGVVQGVGYRPFVAALAEQLHIKGSVRNSGGVVRIDAFGDAEAMDNFICRLRSYAPPAPEWTGSRRRGQKRKIPVLLISGLWKARRRIVRISLFFRRICRFVKNVLRK